MFSIKSRWLDSRILTTFSRCTTSRSALSNHANINGSAAILWSCTASIKPPTVSTVKPKARPGRYSTTTALATHWNLQGHLTNVWPQTCRERGEWKRKWYSFSKEKHSAADETQTNFSKSLGFEILYRPLLYWLLYWFETTCHCVMKQQCKWRNSETLSNLWKLTQWTV